MTAVFKRRFKIGVLVLLALGLYASAYLYLRLNHIFVHRAGNYGYDARLGIERHTNHYIETAMVADGPQIFGMVTLGATASGIPVELENPNFKKLLENAAQQIDAKQHRRDLLFTFFKPAALCETAYWKITNPNPVIPPF